MKTIQLLYNLNTAIAEKFKEIIGQPRQNFADCHKIVIAAIDGLLPENLSYHSWVIRPVDVEHEYDIEVLRLNTDGFEKYKNSHRAYGVKGKWRKAPEYVACLGEDTIEGIVQKQQLKLYRKDVEYYVNHMIELRLNIDKDNKRLTEIQDKIKILER